MSLLDPDDVLDIYALHFAFLPLIQTQLDTFRAQHSLRTERNKTLIITYATVDPWVESYAC